MVFRLTTLSPLNDRFAIERIHECEVCIIERFLFGYWLLAAFRGLRGISPLHRRTLRIAYYDVNWDELLSINVTESAGV